jgi:hypothetical protein
MALTVAQLQKARSDEDVLQLLKAELNALFPPDSRRDNTVFLSRLQTAPRGLRAMAATFELDLSMAMDDLAWHFVNHHDLDLYEETSSGLRELGATEAAELFEAAFAIVKPRWDELGTVAPNDSSGSVDPHDWMEETGIQEQIGPLNKRMWKLLDQWRDHGLMHYWISYARAHPERCVGNSE